MTTRRAARRHDGAMRIIVCPHDMGTGGSQINAIDLACEVRGLGHEVMVYAPEGPLQARVRAVGLDLTPAPTGLRLSLRWSTGLLRLARRWHADLVHTYEWAPSVGAAFGTHLWLGTAQVMTVLSMEVPGFLPRHLDLVVGTAQLAKDAQDHRHVHVLEPPVDTESDAPRPAGPARRSLGLQEDALVVSVVGRLTTDLHKSAGVLAAIEAVDQIAEREPVVLMVAGDGDDAERVRLAAERVNARHGREVVLTPGNLSDPGLAYAAADVVVGMGSSVLRGMAHGRPAVVTGESGFTLPVVPATMEHFVEDGFFGTGDSAAYDLRPLLEGLLLDADERRRIGDWSREMVVRRFGLARAGALLEEIYLGALDRQEGRGPVARHVDRAASLGRSARSVTGFALHRARTRRAAA